MKKLLLFLIMLLFIPSLNACAPNNNTTLPKSETVEIKLHDDFFTKSGTITKTWKKSYDCSEWEDSKQISLFISFPMGNNITGPIQNIEDEINHYLHESGYDFFVSFHFPELDDLISAVPVDQQIEKIQSSGGFIDIYITDDYSDAVKNNRILNLTDTIHREGIYEKYDSSVWSQLLISEQFFYGIPLSPIATERFVFAYNPQLSELLGVDTTLFQNNIKNFEPFFQKMLQNNITPLELSFQNDYLMLSLFGLEEYDTIFCIKHDDSDDSETVINLWSDEAAISFYEQLGVWKENNYLSYDSFLLQSLGYSGTEVDKQMNSKNYDYCFFSLIKTNSSSFFHDVNYSDENTFLQTNFLVPDTIAYIYDIINTDIMVINANTPYPEECKQFLKLFSTDNYLRMLLYCGIEGEHYEWEGKTRIFETAGFAIGLGLSEDQRFLPVEQYSKKYEEEFHEMNQNVTFACMTNINFDFSSLSEEYEACQKLFYENRLVFLGYYGLETSQKLQELHDKLLEAGYMKLIDYMNKTIR